MRILFLLLIVSSTVLFTSCQKDEDQAKPSEVTFASLENEYGIKFYEADDTDSSAITMSLEELKNFLDDFKEEKTFQGKVIDDESVLTKGIVRDSGYHKELIEENVRIIPGVSFKMVAEFYLMENYFNFDIFNMDTEYKYFSTKNQTTIYANTYQNKSRFTLVKEKIRFSVNVVDSGQFVKTDIFINVQIDWIWAEPTCDYTISRKL